MLIALILICVAFIAIGVFLSKKVSRASDFLVAGRGLPVWVLAFTIAASHFGGGALVGGVQQGAELGRWAGMYGILGYAAACFVNAYVAPRFRRAANNMTPPDYVEPATAPRNSCVAIIPSYIFSAPLPSSRRSSTRSAAWRRPSGCHAPWPS